MENHENERLQLPENAFRELKEGEKYEPVMNPRESYPEVNGWSVTWECSWPCSSLPLPHTSD